MNNNLPYQNDYVTAANHKHNTYWMLIRCRDSIIGSLYFKNGRVDQKFVRKPEGWKNLSLKEEEEKKIGYYVTWDDAGNVQYLNRDGFEILKLEEFIGNTMIEYNMIGMKVYHGEYEGENSSGFIRSGHGLEYDMGQVEYDGNWVMNHKKGVGKSYLLGRLYYEGEWDEDLPNGYGEVFGNYHGIQMKGNWEQGYLPINGKYFSYISQRYESLPGINYIWGQVIIAIVMILLLPSLSVLDGSTSFLIISSLMLAYILLLIFCCHFPDQTSNQVSFWLRYLFFVVVIIGLLQNDSAASLSELLFIIGAAFVAINARFIFRIKLYVSFPFEVNAFTFISKKKAAACIYIELAIAIVSIILYYIAFWNYVFLEEETENMIDLHWFGYCMTFEAVIYIVLAYLHCYDNIVFNIGVWFGCIWGIVSTACCVYIYYLLSHWNTSICPHKPEDCDNVAIYYIIMASYTCISLFTSLILYYYNTKKDKQEELLDSQV